MRYALTTSILLLLTAGTDVVAACGPDARPYVVVVHHSVSGHTSAMAQAVAEGARMQPGTCVDVLGIEAATHDRLLAADAIVIGSPVRNGNAAAAVLAWIEQWPFEGRPLEGKVGAAFVTGGGISAGAESTLLSLQRPLLMFGMVVVGGDSWQSAFGAAAVTAEAPFSEGPVSPAFLDKARGLGRRVAALAARLAPAGTAQ